MRHPVLALGVLVACGGGTPSPPVAPVKPTPPATAPPVVQAPDPAPPKLRLPDTVRPTRARAELAIDPTTEEVTGTIEFDLDVRAATSLVWMNQKEIKVSSATFEAGGEKIAARAITPSAGYLGLVLPKALPVGPTKLSIAYRGAMHKNDGTGIYTAQEAGDWYAFTQFEVVSARRAFFCFDESAFKIPFDVMLFAPKGMEPIETITFNRSMEMTSCVLGT